MRPTIPILIMLLLGSVLAGCLGTDDKGPTVEDTAALVPVQDRHLLPFNVSGVFSHTLTDPVYEILDPLSIHVPIDLPTTEGGAAATGDAQVHMGLFLPSIEGCDWSASELPEACQVPVIADVGPYYEDGDVAATSRDSGRLGEFLIQNFVPQGYAVAQVSVFGSGQSNHCMDLMGTAEQLGVDGAVTYLGTQAWSNGHVGLIGRSYDGSTPWQAAMFGNPHLSTIVPISGLIGMHELMWRNGTAEWRGPLMHNVVYGQFGIDSAAVNAFGVLSLNPDNIVTVNDPDPEDAHTLCGDYVLGPAQGAGAYATGDHFASPANPYWSERYFLDRVLENYQGSVYLIQGLQDWNVDPHMAFPTHQLLEEKGIEIKGLYGQWAHMYPDRPLEHNGLDSGYGQEASRHSPRFDWAEDLLEWFDHYLKGTGPKPALHAEVQDNQGAWRIEETYPPRDAHQKILGLGDATKGHDQDLVYGLRDPLLGEGEHSTLEYRFDALEADTRIAGNVLLHATVTPTGPGGQIFATLIDATDDLRLGHGVMDLRYAAGGKEMQPVVPGQPLLAKLEFEAMDVVVPAGHELVLRITPTGMDYLPSAVSTPVLIDPAASQLKLPIVERTDEAFFTPVAWDPCTYPPFVARMNDENEERAADWKERLGELYGC